MRHPGLSPALSPWYHRLSGSVRESRVPRSCAISPDGREATCSQPLSGVSQARPEDIPFHRWCWARGDCGRHFGNPGSCPPDSAEHRTNSHGDASTHTRTWFTKAKHGEKILRGEQDPGLSVTGLVPSKAAFQVLDDRRDCIHNPTRRYPHLNCPIKVKYGRLPHGAARGRLPCNR